MLDLIAAMFILTISSLELGKYYITECDHLLEI